MSRATALRRGAETLHAELLRQRLRARGDLAPQFGGLEQNRLASKREHLALDPLVAADRHVADGGPVAQQAAATLDRPARDVLVVEQLRGAGVAEPRGLETLPRLELLARHLRAPHPVEPERAGAVARPVPGVDVPVRQLSLQRVRLDEAGRGLRVGFLLVLDLDELALAHAAG